MITRFLIVIAASAGAILAPRLHAQSQGPDSFIPNQPPKAGADPTASESNSVKYTLLLPSEKSCRAPAGNQQRSMQRVFSCHGRFMG